MKKIIVLAMFSIFSYASNIPSYCVVKIFTSSYEPNYKNPWQGSKRENFTGSGIVIKDNQILTSAHVVGYAKFIEVQKENDSKKYIATLKYVSNQVDLAILEVLDKEFFKDTKALKFSEDIKYKDSVTVIAYPIGGFFGTKNGVLVIDSDINDIELKKDDILLAINGKKIFSDGTIDTQYGKVNFKLELHTKQIGDIVKLQVLRDKKIVDIEYKVKYSKKIIPKEFDISSRYFVFGGFVFVPFSLNLVNEYGMDSSVANHLYTKRKKDVNKTELVFIQPTIFSHKINRGYEVLGDFVDRVNGVNIVDFKHFVEFIENTKDEYIQIDFQNKERIILKTKEAKDSFEDIKNIYDLKSDRNN